MIHTTNTTTTQFAGWTKRELSMTINGGLIWCRICFHLGHVLFFSKNPTSLFWVGRRGDRFFDRHPNRMRNYQMRGNLLRPSEKITREKTKQKKKKKKVDENLRNKNLSVKVYRVRPTVAN